MAKNQRIVKMKRQQFQRYRGPFRVGSDASTLDADYAKSVTKLKDFWGENIASHPSRQPSGRNNRAEIPDDMLGYFADHAKHRPEHREDNSTPATLYHLATIFPGARFISVQRAAILAKISKLRLDTAKKEAYIKVYETRQTSLRLYCTDDYKTWWFVERNGMQLRASEDTYRTKPFALKVLKMQCITWGMWQEFDSS